MAKISEEDRQIHEDERIQALGGKVSYCPFGCKSESDDLDDHGYCRQDDHHHQNAPDKLDGYFDIVNHVSPPYFC